MAGDEQLGIICCLANDRQFGPDDAELLAAVANQTAVGLKKSELIERLTAENLVKDMFDALAAGSVDAAEAKASEAGCDLSQPHLFVHVERESRAPVEGRVWSALAGRLREQLRGWAHGHSSIRAPTDCGRWPCSRRAMVTRSSGCEPPAIRWAARRDWLSE